jgi:hypothetical protein
MKRRNSPTLMFKSCLRENLQDSALCLRRAELFVLAIEV